MTKAFLLVLCAEFWNTVGQIFFKKSANQLDATQLNGVRSYFAFLRETFRMPLIWLGFLSLGIGLILWIMALSQGDLSAVYPIGSMQYILTLFAARIFLGEKIDPMKLTGTLLVVAGITLIANT